MAGIITSNDELTSQRESSRKNAEKYGHKYFIECASAHKEPTELYEDLKRQPGKHLMLLYHGPGWDWSGDALGADHANVTDLGNAFGGKVVEVQFKERQP